MAQQLGDLIIKTKPGVGTLITEVNLTQLFSPQIGAVGRTLIMDGTGNISWKNAGISIVNSFSLQITSSISFGEVQSNLHGVNELFNIDAVPSSGFTLKFSGGPWTLKYPTYIFNNGAISTLLSAFYQAGITTLNISSGSPTVSWNCTHTAMGGVHSPGSTTFTQMIIDSNSTAKFKFATSSNPIGQYTSSISLGGTISNLSMINTLTYS